MDFDTVLKWSERIVRIILAIILFVPAFLIESYIISFGYLLMGISVFIAIFGYEVDLKGEDVIDWSGTMIEFTASVAQG